MITIIVYAVTAANATQSSWGCYCYDENDQSKPPMPLLDTCLGDLFSVKWMEDAEAVCLKKSLKNTTNFE